jgi:cation diffusion facilitator family transporter
MSRHSAASHRQEDPRRDSGRALTGPAPFDTDALRQRRRLMGFTLALALTLMGVKLAAFWLTGSRALLSDALESVVNVVTGAFGLFSVYLAGQPPDQSHPYGHGKVEFFAAGIQGSMILVAALGIVREAAPRLLDPRPIENLGSGMLLAAAAGVVNCIVGLVLLRRGKRVHSATLEGEGKHLLTDVITTGGVLIGLVWVRMTGWLVIDPVAACVVAVSIAWSGIGLLREAAERLMDRSDPELLKEIAQVLERDRQPAWIEVHLLRAWRSGEFAHMDFHLALPRFWNLEQMHDTQFQLVGHLIRRLGRPGEVLVHADPCWDALCAECDFEPCPIRSAPFVGRTGWDTKFLTGGPDGRNEDRCQTMQAAVSREITRLRSPRGTPPPEE